MGQYVYGSSASAEAHVVRTCEFCGHQFDFSREVSGDGQGTFREADRAGYESGGAYAAAWAEYNAKENAKSKAYKLRTDPKSKANHGVVCPKCTRFSKAAVRRHFADGECRGMRRKTRRFAVIICFVALAFVLAGIAVLAALYQWWSTMHVILRIWAGVSAPLLMFLGVVCFVFMNRALRVGRFFSQAEDTQVHAAVVLICLHAGNRLDWPCIFSLVESGRMTKALIGLSPASVESTRVEPARGDHNDRPTSGQKVGRCCKCGKTIRVKDRATGKRIKCRACRD